MTRILRTTAAAALALAALAAPAVAAWIPVGPAGDHHRVRLDAVDATTPAVGGIWTLLPPGTSCRVALAGVGRARVQALPVFRTGRDPEEFRYAVDLGDTLRRFVRRSARVGTYVLADVDGGPEATAVLGERDVLDLPWSAGRADLVVTSREEERTLLVRVLVADGAVPLSRAEAAGLRTTRVGIDLEMPQLGWDSNAYLTAKGDRGRDGKWFLPLDLETAWHGRAGARTDLEASYGFQGSFYDDPVLDERRHRAQLQGETHLGDRAPRAGVDLALAYRFTHKNDTFNGRGDREEFETIDPGTGATISLRNRFDYNEHRLTAGVARAFGSSWRVDAGVEATRRDYVHDYAALPDVYSLDQDRLEFFAEAVWEPAGAWAVHATLSTRSRDYDEKFSRDAGGNQVVDVPTSLRDAQATVEADYGRPDGPQAGGELKWFRSRDRYEGYWDYDGVAVEGRVGWRWQEGHRVALSVRYSARDYAVARVGYDPAGALREKNILNVRLRGRYELDRHWQLDGSFHYKDSDNNSPAFAYERVLVVAGLRYRR